MSANTIFVILSLIIAAAVVLYLIAVKKGKPSGIIPPSSPEPSDDEDEL